MFLCLNCISLPSLCEEQVGEGGRAGREARCVMSSKCWGLVVLSRTWMCKQKWNCIDASKSTFSLAFMDPQPVFWCTCIQTSVHGITIILAAAWWKRWLRWSRNKHAIECWRHWRQIRGWPKEDISWIMIYTTMYIYICGRDLWGLFRSYAYKHVMLLFFFSFGRLTCSFLLCPLE